MPDTLSTLVAEAKAFYDRKMLIRALPILQMFRAGQKRNLPKRGGNQISYRRMNTLPTATTPLSPEGITPLAAPLSITEITGTVAQYGNYVSISDMLDMFAIDPIISESVTLLGENAAQSVEEIIRAELVTGTSVIYGTGAARNLQSSANPITYALVRRAIRTLKRNDALPFNGSRDEAGHGGMYIGFIHPDQWHDLTGDTTLLNTFSYSDPNKIYDMKIPMVGQVAWVVTTKAPIFAGGGSAGADVYGAILCGKEAFGVVDAAGSGQFQTYVNQLGSAGSADPLAQRATVGWKSQQLPKILNNNFMVRIETGVTS